MGGLEGQWQVSRSLASLAHSTIGISECSQDKGRRCTLFVCLCHWISNDALTGFINNYSRPTPCAMEEPRITDFLYAGQIKATLQKLPCPSDPPCDLVFWLCVPKVGWLLFPSTEQITALALSMGSAGAVGHLTRGHLAGKPCWQRSSSACASQIPGVLWCSEQQRSSPRWPVCPHLRSCTFQSLDSKVSQRSFCPFYFIFPLIKTGSVNSVNQEICSLWQRHWTRVSGW